MDETHTHCEQSIQEFWATPGDTEIKVNLIAGQVKCELKQALNQLVHDNPRELIWLNDWGAQFTLTLTVAEESNLSPGLSAIDPRANAILDFPNGRVTTSQSFTLGLGGTLSSDATRMTKLTFFYKISELLDVKARRNLTCVPSATAAGDLFVQSELKRRDTLNAAITPTFLQTGKLNDKDAIIHQVKFQIVSSGNVSPSWKLVRFTNNTGNTPLFSTSRDRTQDLLITLGPLQTTEKGEKKKALAIAAQNSALAAEIGEAVATALRNAQ